MSKLEQATIFILVCLILTNSRPLNYEESREKICGSNDDYFNSSDEEIGEVFNVLKPMLQVFSTKVDDLKNHYIETFIHDKEICDTADGYTFPFLRDYNGSNKSSNDSRQWLVNLHKDLTVIHMYVEELFKEDELIEKHYQELAYNSEGGIVGMICFSEPYIPLESRQEISGTNVTLPVPINKADHYCRDFHLVNLIHNITLGWTIEM